MPRRIGARPKNFGAVRRAFDLPAFVFKLSFQTWQITQLPVFGGQGELLGRAPNAPAHGPDTGDTEQALAHLLAQ